MHLAIVLYVSGTANGFSHEGGFAMNKNIIIAQQSVHFKVVIYKYKAISIYYEINTHLYPLFKILNCGY